MEEKTRIVRNVFCANEQTETVHELTPALNGEVVVTCDVCQRALKFPANISREEFDTLLTAHADANVGQVSQEKIAETLFALGDTVPVKEKTE